MRLTHFIQTNTAMATFNSRGIAAQVCSTDVFNTIGFTPTVVTLDSGFRRQRFDLVMPTLLDHRAHVVSMICTILTMHTELLLKILPLPVAACGWIETGLYFRFAPGIIITTVTLFILNMFNDALGAVDILQIYVAEQVFNDCIQLFD
jgi:hypothetical protein